MWSLDGAGGEGAEDQEGGEAVQPPRKGKAPSEKKPRKPAGRPSSPDIAHTLGEVCQHLKLADLTPDNLKKNERQVGVEGAGEGRTCSTLTLTLYRMMLTVPEA